MAMTANRSVCQIGSDGNISYWDQKAGTIYLGSMVVRSVADPLLIEEPTVATTLECVGVYRDRRGSQTAAADADNRLQIRTGVFGPYKNSAGADEILQDDVNKNAWLVDGETVAKTDGTATRSPAAYVARVDDDGGVYLDFTKGEIIATLFAGGNIP